MITVFLSCVCSLMMVGAFVAGVAFGYKLKGLKAEEVAQKAETEEAAKERKRMKEETDAFNSLMGYDINRAYGVKLQGSDDS